MRYVGYTHLSDLEEYNRDGFIRVKKERCEDHLIELAEFTEKVEFNTMYDYYDPEDKSSYTLATEEEYNNGATVIVDEFKEVGGVQSNEKKSG